MDSIKILGVGRVADNQRALLIACNQIPSDDDIRKVHEHLRNLAQPEDSTVKYCHKCRVGLGQFDYFCPKCGSPERR